MARRPTAPRHYGKISSIKHDGANVTERRFRPGRVGLALSISSLYGLFGGDFLFEFAWPLTLLSLPGIVFGVVGRFRGEQWPGFWAVLIGIFVAMFLPTLYLAFMRARGQA